MPRTFRLALLLLPMMSAAALSLPAYAQGADVVLSDSSVVQAASRITRAEVYVGGATVIRSAKVRLPAGDSTVSVARLPAGIPEAGLRAWGKGKAQLSIGSVELRSRAGSKPRLSARQSELVTRMEAIQSDLAEVDAKLARIQAQEAMLAGLVPRDGKGDGSALQSNPAQWGEALKQVSEGTVRVQREKRVAQMARQKLADRLAELSSMVGTTTGVAGGQQGTQELLLSVRAPVAGEYELFFEHRVPSATWTPAYQVRLDTKSSRIQLIPEALVRQQTGEDWSGVELVLTTARPQESRSQPSLSSRMLRMAKEEMHVAVAPAAAAAPVNRVSKADAVMASYQQGAVATDGVVVRYSIPGASTVQNGNQKRFRIADLSAEAQLRTVVMPGLSQDAFLQARFTSPASYTLLAGTASLYADNAFLGDAPIGQMGPGEEVRFGMGLDSRVKVTYRPQGNQSGKEWGLTGSSRTVSSEALVLIKSLYDRPHQVVAFEAMPVSRDSSIDVKLSMNPAPDVRDVEGRPGVMEWRLNLVAKEERKLEWGYQVTYPKEGHLMGLPR